MSTLPIGSKTAVKSSRSQREQLSRWLSGDTFTAYAFLAIPLAIFFFIKFYPLFYNIVLSFTKYDLFTPIKFVGLKHYHSVFTEEVTLKAIRNTFYFAIGAVPLGTALALILASLLNQPVRGRVVFRTIYYLPVVTSVVVSAMIWEWIYNPQNGLLNYFLGFVGIPPQNWLSNPLLARPSLIIIMLWGVGSSMVIYLAGLQNIPIHLYEAARIDGANSLQTFWFVTIPLLKPVTLFIVVTSTIAVFRSFGLIFMLTQGGPVLTTNTLVWEVYQNAFGYLRFGKAGAISVVLLLSVLLLTFVNFRLLREE